jgi:hypothetical protein
MVTIEELYVGKTTILELELVALQDNLRKMKDSG